MSELTLFNDTEVQQKTWHIGLSDELQTRLRQRATNIKVISLQATLAIAKELAEAQKELAYKNGGFVKWCEEEADIDFQRAYELIPVWESYKMFPESGNILGISKTVLIESSKKDVPQTARQEIVDRHQSGEKVTLALSEDIIKKHKGEVEAEKQRADEAEQKRKLAQQQLFTTQAQAQEDSAKLNQQIEELKKKIEKLSKPEEIIKEVDKPETKARLEQLEAEKEKLIQQRDNFKQLADELSTELDAQEEKREQEARYLKIRQEWQKLADAMYKSVVKFLGQLPTPVDMEVFESDERARLDQLIEVFRRGANECSQLHSKPILMIVESEMSNPD